MSLIRPTSNVDRGSTPAPAPGGGGGDWNVATASDISTDKQDMQSLSLSASPIAGFDHRVSIVRSTTGVFNAFERNKVGVVYVDTGFSVDDIGQDNLNTAIVQVQAEFAGIEAGSSYELNVGFPTGICLFSSFTPPPFNTGTKGGFYGGGLLHWKPGTTNLVANTSLPRRMKDQPSAPLGTGGSDRIYAYPSGQPFHSLLHTLTLCQGRTGLGNAAMCSTQGDFNGFQTFTADNNLQGVINVVEQVESGFSSFTVDSNDKVRVGIMFNIYIDASQGGSSPSPTINWDFNLKWRKLNAEA